MTSDTAPLPVALSPLGFLELPPPRLVDLAAAAGFAAVSVRLRAAAPGGEEHRLRPGDPLLRETVSRVRATGVTVDHVEVFSAGAEAPDEDLPLLEAAAELGARRVVATGDDPDHGRVADRLAALCETASGLGLVVDLEFMPFRPVRTLAEAVAVVERAGGAASGAHVLVDALHLARSGGTPADVAAVAPALLGACHLCDARAVAPAADGLAAEARGDRLPPGEGALPLAGLLAVLQADAPLLVEVPLAPPRAGLDALERARLLRASTARLLATAPRGGDAGGVAQPSSSGGAARAGSSCASTSRDHDRRFQSGTGAHPPSSGT